MKKMSSSVYLACFGQAFKQTQAQPHHRQSRDQREDIKPGKMEGTHEAELWRVITKPTRAPAGMQEDAST